MQACETWCLQNNSSVSLYAEGDVATAETEVIYALGVVLLLGPRVLANELANGIDISRGQALKVLVLRKYQLQAFPV